MAELLVVMLVLGIAAALVSVRLVASDRDRGLRLAQELAVSLEHAALAAEWRGRNILWRHQEAGWTFLIEERGEGGASWQPLRDESSLAPRSLPEGMRIVGFERAGLALVEPRLLFATHGINDPFSLHLGLGEQVWRLSGDALGRVKVEPQ
ncbi:MAG: hypothetical protein HYZ17_09150 [Betaproteobacteria bacterium]|nr:hypothetical protein [Betaproteobacteria bacterium]